MNQAPQHKNLISRKALTIALVCAFIIQPFTPIIALADTGSTATTPVGFLDSASCTSFEGWAYDTDNSSASVNVDFYTDDSSGHSFFISVNAGLARADVNASQNVMGNHGFSVPTPDSLKDGQSHLIYAYAIDSNGGSNSLLTNSPIQISGCAPALNTAPSTPIVVSPASVTAGVLATFSATAIDPQGDQVAYAFDWNNDTTIDSTELTGFVSSGTAGSLSYSFPTAGTYTVPVSARDSFGLPSLITTIQVVVSAAGTVVVPPVVNTAPSTPIVVSPASVTAGVLATFSATAIDPQGDQVAYAFDWNNDTTIDSTELTGFVSSGTAGSLSYSFPTAGTYTVPVSARDSFGLPSLITTIQVVVSAAGTVVVPPVVNTAPSTPIVVSPASVTAGVLATFSATAIDPQGDQVAYAFDWNNDTTIDSTELTGFVSSGTAGSLSYSFPTAGTYTVPVSARDSFGLPSLITTIQVVVSAAGTVVVPPVVNTAPSTPIVVSPASVTAGVLATFSATAIDPQGDQVAYAFDWNNDTTIDSTELTGFVSSGTAGSLSYSFPTAGTYTVPVSARDSFGLPSLITTIQVVVSAAGTVVVPPVVPTNFISVFNISPTTIQSGQTALLTWSAASNAILCVASGDWTGYQSLSNTFNVGVQNFAITTNKTYTLECGNGTASTTQSVHLTINPVTTGGGSGGGGTPLIGLISSFSAFPNPVLSGASSTLSWSSTNATLCVASGGIPSGTWTGNQLTAGTYTITPVTVAVATTVIYSIACGNTLGTSTAQVSFTVNPTVVLPTIDFTVSPVTGLSTSESGATASFAVALASVPTANVTLPILSSNFAEGTTSVTNLVFTPANWNLPQNVVVTGRDDAVVDGPISYFITVGASVSTDAAWNNIPAKTVGVTNTDNDTAVVVVVPPTGGGSSGGGGGHGGGGGGGGPCFGYGCVVVTVTPTTTPVVIYPPVVTTVTTSGPSRPELVCPTTNFITSFMRVGIDNNPNEVRKLQYFLNTYEGASIVVDGDFNGQTEAAVMAMQAAHSQEILAPWGVTLPTGIVYITTARYINRVFCSQNPTYTGNESLKDIIDSSVIDKPVDNTAQFEGVVGMSTTTNTISSNVAGVFGAMTDGLIHFIKDIPWYQLLILLLIFTGCWFIIGIAFRKDISEEELHMSLIRGSAALAIGSVLNVLNTLSFILNPVWFTSKAGFGLGWLLTLDTVNLFAIIVICLTILITLYERVVRRGIN